VIFSSLFVWLFALWSAFASPAPVEVAPPAAVSGFAPAPEVPAPAPGEVVPAGDLGGEGGARERLLAGW